MFIPSLLSSLQLVISQVFLLFYQLLNMSSVLSWNEDLQNSLDDSLSLCCYRNITDQIQILRLKHLEASPWEKIIFPGERIMFTAQPQVKLEIQTSEEGKILISCQQLLVI